MILAAAKSRCRSKAHAPAVFCIEGERVTYAQIAMRLHCTTAQARTRMETQRAKGAVTWTSLARVSDERR